MKLGLQKYTWLRMKSTHLITQPETKMYDSYTDNSRHDLYEKHFDQLDIGESNFNVQISHE